MSTEIFRQWDMFSRKLVDVHTRGQQRPAQVPLFSTREMVEMGANARPWLNEMPAPVLELQFQDIRTDEEKEREAQRAAESLTAPMFAEPLAPCPVQAEETIQKVDEPIPVAWVSKQALASARPDLTERIQELNTADMVLIAKRVREVLEKNYQMVLDVTLNEYLNVDETSDDDE